MALEDLPFGGDPVLVQRRQGQMFAELLSARDDALAEGLGARGEVISEVILAAAEELTWGLASDLGRVVMRPQMPAGDPAEMAEAADQVAGELRRNYDHYKFRGDGHTRAALAPFCDASMKVWERWMAIKLGWPPDKLA